MLKNKRVALIVGLGLGATGGFLFWKFVGCVTGTCAIWQNMWMSTAYGAILGWLIISTTFDIINYIKKQKQKQNS